MPKSLFNSVKSKYLHYLLWHNPRISEEAVFLPQWYRMGIITHLISKIKMVDSSLQKKLTVIVIQN